MTDKEKVLTWLEICGENRDCSGTCPYSGPLCGEDDAHRCREDLMADALSLLKEQEPKKVIRKQMSYEDQDGTITYYADWYCPHCGKLLKRGFEAPWIEFCYKCGKAVKWDE